MESTPIFLKMCWWFLNIAGYVLIISKHCWRCLRISEDCKRQSYSHQKKTFTMVCTSTIIYGNFLSRLESRFVSKDWEIGKYTRIMFSIHSHDSFIIHKSWQVCFIVSKYSQHGHRFWGLFFWTTCLPFCGYHFILFLSFVFRGGGGVRLGNFFGLIFWGETKYFAWIFFVCKIFLCFATFCPMFFFCKSLKDILSISSNHTPYKMVFSSLKSVSVNYISENHHFEKRLFSPVNGQTCK